MTRGNERTLIALHPKSIWANPRWEMSLVMHLDKWGLGARFLNATWAVKGGAEDGGSCSYRELASFLGPFTLRLGRVGNPR